MHHPPGKAVRRRPGLSARAKLALSYAAFVMVAGVLLLTAAWLYLFRRPLSSIPVPSIKDFMRVFDPTNFGPSIFIPAAILILGFLLVFGLGGGWLLAGRMLAPLNRIADATRAVAQGSLSHRIRLEGNRDEFRELADSFDEMLARLEAHDAELQRFAANASHELRTPLAIMQTMLDVSLKDPTSDRAELDERLRAVNARAIALTESLLLLSRADHRSFVPERVDLSLVVEEACEALLPLSEKHGVRVTVLGEPAYVNGSHALLTQVVTNLLQNAIVHSGAAPNPVEISTRAVLGAAVLTCQNSGNELSGELISTLTEPFQRGTDRTHVDSAGVGLGLAIVKSVVRAHDGTLTMAPRPGGGLIVEVRLPAV